MKRVRWLQIGTIIVDGSAEVRSPGDEDVMGDWEARTHSTCGLVEVLGDASEIPVLQNAQSVTTNEEPAWLS